MPWQEPPQQKTYACNGEVIAALRQKREWTQRQLAQLAGYSDRLIAKAEAGLPILAVTVADLADSLSTAETPVHPEDLISDPIAMAKAYIGAQYEHTGDCIDYVRHFMDENILMKWNGDPEIFPFTGEHRGIGAIERAIGIFFTMILPPPNHDWRPWYRFVGQGNEVIVWGQNWMGPIGRPLSEPMKLVHRFVFRRGKMVYHEVLFDAAQGAKFLEEAGMLEEARQLRGYPG